ncbi:MAG: hypothetical protein AABY07_10845, partial [Nanoarchaeota archaeon]
PILASTWTFKDTHTYKAFDSASEWSSSGSFSHAEGGIRLVSSGNTFANSVGYRWKPLLYRYHKISIKASKKDVPIRLYLIYGTVQYIWIFYTTAANTWETKTFDILHPQKKEITGVESGFTGVLHLDTIGLPFPSINGGPLRIRVDDVCEAFIRDLKGYYKPEPTKTENRKKILLCYPLLGTDGIIGGATGIGSLGYPSGGGNGIFMRSIVNGARSFYLLSNADVGDGVGDGSGNSVFKGGCIRSKYKYYRSVLDNNFSLYNPSTFPFPNATNDTGLGITVADTVETKFWAGTSRYNSNTGGKPWLELTPLSDGSDFVLQIKDNETFTNLDGYYGSGNFRTGEYGTTLSFQFDAVWNGEGVGTMNHAKKPVKNVFINLHDQSSESLIKSASSNDDGFYRLFYKYGVKWPHNNIGDAPEFIKPFLSNEATLSYTSQGETMNPYWIKGSKIRTTKDSSGFITAISTDQFDTTPFRYRLEILTQFLLAYDFNAIPVVNTLDQKKHPAGKLFTTYLKTNNNAERIHILKQENMDSLANPINTNIIGSSPNIELSFDGDAHYLIYIDENQDLQLKKTIDEFNTLT